MLLTNSIPFTQQRSGTGAEEGGLVIHWWLSFLSPVNVHSQRHIPVLIKTKLNEHVIVVLAPQLLRSDERRACVS